MPLDPVDLIATPKHLIAWYRCAACGERQLRDERLQAGAECVRCTAPIHTSDRFAYASARHRILANLVDFVCLLVPLLFMGVVFSVAFQWLPTDRDGFLTPTAAHWANVAACIAVAAYLAVVQAPGRSPGKALFSLRVVDVTTWRRPGIAVGFLRLLGIVLTIATAGLGFFVMLVDPEGRALHDRLAGTRVIEK